MKFSRVAALASLTLVASSAAFANFDIVPVFDPGIANDPRGAAIEATIDSMISMYESKFTDDITVKVYFQKGGGLGSNTFGYYYGPAGSVMDALSKDVTSADDAEGVSHFNTVGYGSLATTSANGRAMGMNTPGFLSAGGEGGFDGIISLNTDICFTDHDSPQPGLFDLYSVAAHELDETLGTVSGAGDWLAFSADLYRYDGNGNRNFSGDTNAHVYFSIDGKNMIDEYNQYGRYAGDWGDWISHSPSQTQDWAIGSGIRIDPGEPEFRLLDAVGYDRAPAPVPEPATLTALGVGAAAILRRRR